MAGFPDAVDDAAAAQAATNNEAGPSDTIENVLGRLLAAHDSGEFYTALAATAYGLVGKFVADRVSSNAIFC